MSGFGPGADWYRNLLANGRAEIVIGRDRFGAAVRVLSESEASEALAGYEHQNRLVAPVVRLVLSQLLGWRYDSSPESRRRVVHQLPLLALTPASVASVR